MTLLVGSIFHMTRKIVSEMTYNVSMGTLNPTIPYHTDKLNGNIMKFYTAEKVVTLVRCCKINAWCIFACYLNATVYYLHICRQSVCFVTDVL